MPCNHLILCCPLLLPPSIFPSIRVFSNESFLHIRWPTYWSFSFSISPFNEYSGLISFRMGWLDLLAVQGTLKSLFQHHSSKASILQCSAFFIVQLSHPYMTTGKTIALTRWTFVGKVIQVCLTLKVKAFPNSPLCHNKTCFTQTVTTDCKSYYKFLELNLVFLYLSLLLHPGASTSYTFVELN